MALTLRPVFAGLIALLTAALADAAVYTDADQLPSTSYDFVVVGGAQRRTMSHRPRHLLMQSRS